MTASGDFSSGKHLLAAGRSFDSLPHFQRAYEQNPGNPEYQSYYGLVTALERGQIAHSLELCREAVKGAPSHPELYANLARVYLKSGQKAEAVAALREGLQVGRTHTTLRSMLGELGVRRPPIFGSLPRGHPLNKYLGLIAARLHLR